MVAEDVVIAGGQMAFEFGDGSRSDDDGINVEFFAEFAMPLVAEVGWTKDGNAANVSTIE